MSHEDDWDRNRCSNGMLGKEGCPLFDDDRGMGMSAFDGPEEEQRILGWVLEHQNRTRVSADDDDGMNPEDVKDLLRGRGEDVLYLLLPAQALRQEYQYRPERYGPVA